MKYEFTIPRKYGEIEDSFVNDNDVACFKVFDNQGNDIGEQIRYIEMFLNTNAMIGLGTELIRLAHNYEEGKEVLVGPISKKEETKQSMGIFLTSNSCKLVIKCQSSKTVEELLQEYKKNDEQEEK